MYYEEKKKNKEKLIMYCFMVVIIALLLILVLRSQVGDVEKLTEYRAEKINFDENIKEEENVKKVDTNNVQKAVEAIVGISKLKQSGSLIFVNNAEEKLGLGSRSCNYR